MLEEEPKDLIVLGAIKNGNKKFDKIVNATKIKPEELNQILKKLEERGFIQIDEKKGFFGPKIELNTTDKGLKEMDERVHELQQDWTQMVSLYKSGDKKKLQDYMNEKRSFFPTMMYFGIIDMMIFSMMFSMMGVGMSDFFAGDTQGMDFVNDGGLEGDGGIGDGGFDIDIGF